MGKGTDWIWVTDESDRELGTPTWPPSLKPEGILQRGSGEGDTSSLEEPGTLGGLRDWSVVDEDLGRRCRMEEKKEQDSGRGMVPIPLSNVRIVQPEPVAHGEQLKWVKKEGTLRAQQEKETGGPWLKQKYSFLLETMGPVSQKGCGLLNCCTKLVYLLLLSEL